MGLMKLVLEYLLTNWLAVSLIVSGISQTGIIECFLTYWCAASLIVCGFNQTGTCVFADLQACSWFDCLWV